jgi:hypothetical protein
MIEIAGDLWEAHALGHWVAITTNPVINSKGNLVMGRGVALEAARRFPELPRRLADLVGRYGNRVLAVPEYRLLSFPVKHHWRDYASLSLIERSAHEIVDDRFMGVVRYPVYLVRPGCGNGRLQWAQVREIIAPILDNRFIIVERPTARGCVQP